jgi:bifunctional ADP-heptose synthase (sugar kinase/adenylyltransferase)
MSLSVLNALKQDPEYLARMRMLAVGDVAFDRTFRCRTAPSDAHATHGGEINYDIDPNGDDYGRVGGPNNGCLFATSFGAHAALVSAVGDDEEGDRVRGILAKQKIDHKCFVLDGVQTVSRLRFFLYNENDQTYRLTYRMNKEPDRALASAQAEKKFRSPLAQEWLHERVRESDFILINDTEKGFLSQPVLQNLGEMITAANKHRLKCGLPEITTIVDPKNSWSKFCRFPVKVLKPNHKDACREVQIDSTLDFTDKKNIIELAGKIYQQHGEVFQTVVLTLGKAGAILIRNTGEGATVERFPEVKAPNAKIQVATACGDVFGTALGLALAKGEDLESAITFANCAGSLQYSRVTGTVVNRGDMLSETTLNHIEVVHIRHERAGVIPDEKEIIARRILRHLGRQIDYRDALYSHQGRAGSLIAGPEFSKDLDRLATLAQPGKMLFVYGEPGAGKGAILANFGVFVPGYMANEDCHNAADVLDISGQLDPAVARAQERRTCLVLDEIQGASDAGITKLLSAFSKQDFGKPFCLVLAGHFNAGREPLRDLFQRCVGSHFEVLPYSHPKRRFDLPYLIASFLLERNIRYITALALRELLRCDYHSETSQNYRALDAILGASCSTVSDNVLEWRHLDFGSIGVRKARNEPQKPELNYRIEIVREAKNINTRPV